MTSGRIVPDISRLVFSANRISSSYGHSSGNGMKASASGLDDVLRHGLLFVPESGFTDFSLRRACHSLGLSSAAASAFPRGAGVALAELFVTTSTTQTAQQLLSVDLHSKRVPERIKTAVKIRLELLKPVVHHWPQALALMAMPQNAKYSLLNLSHLIDEIWYAAGDRSVDMNWYSKRILLAGVYTSTELFMTQDKSPDFIETDKFLDRRLQDVAFVGRTTEEVRKMADFGVRSALGVVASRGWMK